MISYLVTAEFAKTIRPYLDTWVPDMAGHFRVITYEDLPDVSELPRATTIFSDLERLNRNQFELARAVAASIRRSHPDVSILNHPSEALLRYDVLETLFQAGLNPYRAYRLADWRKVDRLPVFLRYEHDHRGPRTGLLRSKRELEVAAFHMLFQGSPRSGLIVEYHDTASPEGVYHKYGAFIVGDRVMARHFALDRNWIIKGGGMKTDEAAAFEQEYVETNPHVGEINRVVEKTRIGYGRIDYSMKDGQLVTWEINTNPVLVHPRGTQSPAGMRKQNVFIPRITAAFEAIGAREPSEGTISLADVGEATRSAARPNIHRRDLFQRIGRGRRKVTGPLLGVLERAAAPLRHQILTSWANRSAARDSGLGRSDE